MQEKIIILDFGSQYTQLIARRLRELNTYCEILPYNKFPYLFWIGNHWYCSLRMYCCVCHGSSSR